jgi:hypothetical protein
MPGFGIRDLLVIVLGVVAIAVVATIVGGSKKNRD